MFVYGHCVKKRVCIFFLEVEGFECPYVLCVRGTLDPRVFDALGPRVFDASEYVSVAPGGFSTHVQTSILFIFLHLLAAIRVSRVVYPCTLEVFRHMLELPFSSFLFILLHRAFAQR